MQRHTLVVRILAILGTVLLAIPLIAPLVTARWGGLFAGRFMMDWLMPGELGVLAFVGAAVLLTAALIAKSRRLTVGIGICVAIAGFALMSVLAETTGLASGDVPAQGWPFALVISMYACYVAAVVELFVVGVLLCRDAFEHHEPIQTAPPAIPVA